MDKAKSSVILVALLFGLGTGARLAAIHYFESMDKYGYDGGGYLLFGGEKGADDREYEGRGWNLVAGKNFFAVEGDGNAPPGYPFLIAVIYSFLGRNLYLLLLVNALLGGATAVGTFYLAQQFVTVRPALLAGIGVALDPLLVFWSMRVLTETLSVFLASVILIAILKLSQDKIFVTGSFLAGSLMAIGVLVRNNFAIFVLAYLAWWWILSRKGLKKKVNLVLTVVTFLAISIPVTLVGVSQRPPGTIHQLEQLINYYQKSLGNEGENSGSDQEQARELHEALTSSTWKNLLRRWGNNFMSFWRLVPTAGTGSWFERMTYALSNFVLWGLAGLGVWLGHWRGNESRKTLFLFLIVIVGFTVLHCLVWPNAHPRYRLPLQPILWTLASQGVWTLCGHQLKALISSADPISESQQTS